MKTDNSLTHPFETTPFDQIKVEHYKPAIEKGIQITKSHIEKIKSLKDDPSFENTILALETASEELDRFVTLFYVVYSAHATEQHQKLAPQIATLLATLQNDITLDEILFKKIKSVHDKRKSLQLTQEESELLNNAYKSFTRNGSLLNKADKEKLRAIDQNLAKLIPQYSENVLAATNAFELHIEDKKELEGLPETAQEAAAELAKSKDKEGWVFNLQAPSLLPVLDFSKNRELRKKIWIALATRCCEEPYNNKDIIKNIITLRNKRARLLGYTSHAEYVLSDRMAESPQRVNTFLEELLTPSRIAIKKELAEIREYAKAHEGFEDIMGWDLRYLMESLRKEKYAYDEETLRSYFELESVYKGAFYLASKLYKIEFKEVQNIPLYHDEVKVFEVHDLQKNRHLGLLYMDFFPRETKRDGAWMTNIIQQGLYKKSIKRPHIGIVMNFTRPTETKPSLLTFNEVRTLFHEFGHALHGLLTQCTYRSISGTNVYWDFVELPSQFMENWILEKDVLDLFAKHYKTKEPLPMDLFKKVKASAQFMAGYQSLRQLSFATLDMSWHTTDPDKIQDVEDFEQSVMDNFRLTPHYAGAIQSCSFSHIFAGGYSAGYYSYKWAEVLDADAFEYFKENGLFNEKIALSFKTNILERGGSENPMTLYKRFRGQEPDPKALLRRDGLI